MISGWRWQPGPGVVDDRRDRRVHRAGQVADALVARPVVADRALVVERPGRVVAAHPGGGRLVVAARSPDSLPSDQRMTDGWFLSRSDHPRDPVDPRGQVARVVAQRALERVRLDVGLVDDVQPELVGQVEEGRVVRVVRGPDRVEPELLHQDEVGAHRLGRDDPAGVLVEVVAVDAADEDPRAVDQQVQAADLDPAEADPDGGRLGDRAVGGAQRRRAAGRGPAARPTSGATSGTSTCHVTRPSSGGAIRRWTACPGGLVLGRQQARRVRGT